MNLTAKDPFNAEGLYGCVYRYMCVWSSAAAALKFDHLQQGFLVFTANHLTVVMPQTHASACCRKEPIVSRSARWYFFKRTSTCIFISFKNFPEGRFYQWSRFSLELVVRLRARGRRRSEVKDVGLHEEVNNVAWGGLIDRSAGWVITEDRTYIDSHEPTAIRQYVFKLLKVIYITLCIILCYILHKNAAICTVCSEKNLKFRRIMLLFTYKQWSLHL